MEYDQDQNESKYRERETVAGIGNTDHRAEANDGGKWNKEKMGEETPARGENLGKTD